MYLFIASIYFIVSLKFSGAEGYHRTGIVAYAKMVDFGTNFEYWVYDPSCKIMEEATVLGLSSYGLGNIY